MMQTLMQSLDELDTLIKRTKEAHEAQSGKERLWGWFGFSYASFLTLPRVLMCEMPDDWQKRMAVCLEEYEDAYPNHPNTDCLVMHRQGNRFAKWPEWLIRYRHADRDEVANARGQYHDRT